MYTKKELSKVFWSNVDKLKGDMTYKKLSVLTNIKYKRIQDQKSLGALPNLTDAIAIAKLLNTTVTYLLFNEKEENYLLEKFPILEKLKSDSDFLDLCNNLALLNSNQLTAIEAIVDSYLINRDISVEKDA